MAEEGGVVDTSAERSAKGEEDDTAIARTWLLCSRDLVLWS
jgi:hypothetical protein